MKIQLWTPALRMKRTAIVNRSFDWLDEVAADYGVTKNEVFAALQDIATLSLRINGQRKALDFELMESTDDSATIREKLVAYLNTENPQAVWDMEAALAEFDRPVNVDTAPEPPDDPEA